MKIKFTFGQPDANFELQNRMTVAAYFLLLTPKNKINAPFWR